jgi:starch-binding outer membrane protein, SusD/RagB family
MTPTTRRTCKTLIAGAAALLFMAAASCTDTTVEPKSTVSDDNIFNDPSAYTAFIAKLYAGLAVTGQVGPHGNTDIQTPDEGFNQYVRVLWYSQEIPTDEAVLGWGDPGVPDLNRWNWGPSNYFLQTFYYRVYYQVQLANEFLRQTTDAKLAERGHTDASLVALVHQYRAEARFLRALSYWHGIDAYGDIPLVTDAQPLSATPPPQNTRAEVYDFVVSELTDIIAGTDLPAQGAATYGRANKWAAEILLANVYLNAEVYTGTPHYDLALAAAQNVINSGVYTLDTNITFIVATPNPPVDAANAAHTDTVIAPRVFLADNDQSSEMIFPVTSDGTHTQTWGGTTFLIHAACGGLMDTRVYGTNGCWAGLRLKPQTYNRYTTNDLRASGWINQPWNHDTLQSLSVTSVGPFSSGKGAPKFYNRRADGTSGSNLTHPDADYPMFRLTEAYLIYAEATARGAAGGNAGTALNYVNAIRTRAGLGAWAAAPLDSVFAERSRELRWEGKRRTDLIRFGLFTGGSYVWDWKGNAQAGTTTDAHFNLYPIPSNELIANPNMRQNTGY